MTVERYNTPNHPRWSLRTDDEPTKAGEPHQQNGTSATNSSRRQTDGRLRTDPPLVVSRDATEDDSTVKLRNTSNRVWVTIELPDRSLDDVHVSVSGVLLRIRAAPSDDSPQSNGIDRTITLTGPINPAEIVVAYDDPALTVIVPDQPSEPDR